MNLLLTIILWTTYAISLYFSIFWFLIFLESHTSFSQQNSKRSSKLKRFPLISIAIPAYNEQENVVGTIQSVMGLNYPPRKMEIFVIDDGSTDNTKKIVQDFIKAQSTHDISLISHKNMGKGPSLNVALKKAKGEFFACIDADSYIRPEALARQLKMFEDSKESLAIVTPAMRVRNPKTLLQRIQQIEYIFIMYMARIMSQIDCLYVAPGPFSVYRMDVLKGLGGFDEDNITEDQEIAYRAQAHHYQVKQCHNAYVDTVAPENFKSLYHQRNRWFKGGLINALKYRFMLFNREYGDFGMVQMAVNLLLFFLATTAVFFFAYYMFYPIISRIIQLSYVGFDIWPYIQTFQLKFSLLSINIESVFLVYLMLFITVVILFFSYRNAEEKLSQHKYVFIPYFLVYYLVLSVVAVIVLVETMVGKKQKW